VAQVRRQQLVLLQQHMVLAVAVAFFKLDLLLFQPPMAELVLY
jgi:hypothetical protein